MVVISDIDDDPLIYRLGFAWRADNVLSMCCHCSVSAQKVLATGSPFLSGACSKNTSNHHGSLRFAELNCRLSETRYVQRLS